MVRSKLLPLLLLLLLGAGPASSQNTSVLIRNFLERQGLAGDAKFTKYANLVEATVQVFNDCLGKGSMDFLYEQVVKVCETCRNRPPLELSALLATETPATPTTVAPPATTKEPERKDSAAVGDKDSKNAISPADPSKPDLPIKAGDRNLPIWSLPWSPRPHSGRNRDFYYYPIPVPVFYPFSPFFDDEQDSLHVNKRDVSKATRAAPGSNLASKLAQLVGKMHHKISNITCILQEMTFLGPDRLPDYEALKEVIEYLPVDPELIDDLVEGIELCKQITSCLPTSKLEKLPVAPELAVSVSFFKCFEGRKIAACLKNDLRQKYAAADAAAEGDAAAAEAEGRSGDSPRPSTSELDPGSVFNMLFGFDFISLGGTNMILNL